MKCQKVIRTTKTCNNKCGYANNKGRKKCTACEEYRSTHAGTIEKGPKTNG